MGDLRRSVVHGLESISFSVDHLDGADYLDERTVIEAMAGPLQRCLSNAMSSLAPREGDSIGIRISGFNSEGGAIDIHIPFQPAFSISLVDLLNRMENALNSNEAIELPLEVIFVKKMGNRFNQIEGKSGVTFTGDYSSYTRSKKSIIQINPENDEFNNGKNCFAQWIVIGLAYLVYCGSKQPIPELTIDSRTYTSLIKSAGKFNARRRISQLLKQIIPMDEINQAVMEKVENYFNVHLVLFSIRSMICEYPPQQRLPYQDCKEVICGFLTGNNLRGDWTHVDFISKPTAFHPETNHKSFRFCYFCLRLYKRKNGCDISECRDDFSPRCSFCHVCGDNACTACDTSECGFSNPFVDEEECIPFVIKTKCQHCFKVLYSPKCQELHLLSCKTVHCKRCDECGNKAHTGLKCHEQRCFFCAEKFMKANLENHRCFIKREKLKENKAVLATYDFECCIGENNVHVPYLCTVWFPESHPLEDSLADEYPFERRSDGTRVFVFWGLGSKQERTGVYEFFSFCSDPRMKGTVFWAHNARAYDSILVKSYFAKYFNQYSVDIQRGQKFMSMRYTELEIDFRDSLSFIPSSLRSMSEDFGIVVETEVNGVVERGGKDFFPHSYVTEAYLISAEEHDFITPKPPVEEFEPDYRAGRAGISEEKEYKQWIEQNYDKWGDFWNVKTEAVKYCIKDTVLLGKVLIKFRDQLAQMTASIPRGQGVEMQEFDALAYITLPSAMMSFFLSQIIEEHSIGVIHSSLSRKFRDAECWFLWLEFNEGFKLEKRPVCVGERFIHCVDVNCQTMDDQGEWYLYLDCYEHGCNRCYASFQRNIVKNRTFGELWFQICADLRMLRSSLKIHCLWTHEWRQEQMKPEFKQWYSSHRIEDELPLIPRDAYKGGKVECFKIGFPGEIQMSDFVSQYPTTLLGESYDPLDVEGEPQKTLEWAFPVGIPSRYFKPKFLDEQGDIVPYNICSNYCLGIIKCRVMCPSDLYAPFLGYKVPSRLSSNAYEVIYGSCRTCMEERSYPCLHSTVMERSFVGTWTVSEVRYAVKELRYEIIEVIELWEYENSSKHLFKSFIAPFMVEKIRSKRSGLVDEEGKFTEKGHKVNDYMFELIGKRLEPSEIEDNPARRQVAKLAQNSFTGKWGEIEVHRSSRTFSRKQADESRKLLTDPAVDVLFAQILDEEGDVVIIEFEPKFNCSRAARRKNDIIVAHITAYGRTMLSRLEQVLGDDLLYEDTDSAFHKKLSVKKYRDGFRTGDLELELKSGSKWVCCGRKWYAYYKGEDPISKIKGFTLRRSNANLFTPDSLFKLFVDCKEAYDDSEFETAKAFNSSDSAPAIEVEQRLFKTVKPSPLELQKETHVSIKKAQFQICSQKRHILFPQALRRDQISFVDTVPFGYK